MKKLSIISIVLLTMLSLAGKAQEDISGPEKYGNTLNVGAGIGYYGYVGHTIPVMMLNYEFDVARNFTLAPFIGVYSYRNYYYWGNPEKPNWDPSYRRYSYRTTAIPVGVKGTYYFDNLLHADEKWDFYAAASIGFVFRKTVWEDDYYGDRYVYQNVSPLYLDAHIGAEYHINQRVGLFLDLSTGVSTFGLGLHF